MKKALATFVLVLLASLFLPAIVFVRSVDAQGNSEWTPIELVSDFSTGDTEHHDLRVDRWGNVHFIIMDNTPYLGAGGDYDLFYRVKHADGTWSNTEVAVNDDTWSSFPSLAIDSLGQVHVVWKDEGDGWNGPFKVGYAMRRVDGSWTDPALVGSSYIYGKPALDVDSKDNVHIVWDNGANIFHYIRSPAGIWTNRTIASGYPNLHPKVRVDSSDNVHVTWWVEGGDVYYLKIFPDGTPETPSPVRVGGPGRESQLAIDSNGTPHAVWYEWVGGSARRIWYAKKLSSGGWSTPVQVNTGPSSMAANPDVAVSPQGVVHVVWVDSADYAGSGGDQDVFYRKCEGDVWSAIEVLTPESSARSDIPCLEADASGALHLSWLEQGQELVPGAGMDWDIYYRSCPSLEWPMFHHDLQHTGYSSSTSPSSNNKLWSYDLGSATVGEASPVVADNRVFIGGGINGKVYALNASTGRSLWNFSTSGDQTWRTLTYSNGRLYVPTICDSPPGSGDRRLYCLDARTGNPIWSLVPGDLTERSGANYAFYMTSVALVNDRLYFGVFYRALSYYRVFCYQDLGTSAVKLWEYALSGDIDTMPAVCDGIVYIASYEGLSAGVVNALNASEYCSPASRRLWSYPTGGDIDACATVAYGRVFIGSTDGKVYCLDARTGSPRWNQPRIIGSAVKTTAAVHDGKVYVGSGNGKLYCLDKDTGYDVWPPFQAGGAMYYSSPAVADGRVFVGSEDRCIYALNAATGSPIWEYETNGLVNSSPAVAYGRLYAASDDHRIYCFESFESHDLEAPTTVASFSGTLGRNGWYVSDVAVTLRAADSGSGVNKTYYSLDEAAASEVNDPLNDLILETQEPYPPCTGPTDLDITHAEIAQINASYIVCKIQVASNIDMNSGYKGYRWLLDTDKNAGTAPGCSGYPWTGDIGYDFHLSIHWGQIQLRNMSLPYYVTLPPSRLLIYGNTVEVTVALAEIGSPTSFYWMAGTTNGVDRGDYAPNTGHATFSLWSEYLSPFLLSTEGSNTIRYFSVDNAGNREDAHRQTVKIDRSAPVVNINTPTEYGVYATGSGTVYDFNANDNIDLSPTVNGSVRCFDGSSNPVTSGSLLPSISGVYTLVVNATDQAGLSSSKSVMFVVYDSSAGFVTGGGWFNSTAGAYAYNPSLTGKATFGFVSKYQKGAQIPTGETEFQFRVADLNFHSSSYEWMVVAGAKAQYKGVGTINGAGEYGFMLTAIDGQVNGGGGTDKFRIKIWEIASGGIVYDNKMGGSDTDNPTTVIAGGSIVIHKG